MTTQTKTSTDAVFNSSDLDRLAELASLVAAAQDALTDDMVSRLAAAMSEGLTLLDRLTRNEGLVRLLQVLDHPENQTLLLGLSDALTATSRDIAAAAPAKGGIVGMLQLAREPGTQEGLRMLSLLGKHLSESMREMHHRGD
ncbi:MAG: hypothetical protein BMS9Abin26_1565 [Gammaproteobacteria bacterium]|nr:MAG: hypothetical protein BMS9Abin26_1565 [Gammaproteobacteria bacterium]